MSFMKILFLVYHGFSDYSGISKKIHYQVKGLRENGHQVFLCYYDFDANGHRCRYIDDKVIKDYGVGLIAGLRQRLDYNCIYDFCKEASIGFVYARCFQNASPFLISFFRKVRKLGIKTVTEIPTYPYDAEFRGFPFMRRVGLAIDKLFRKKLYSQMTAIVTFSDAKVIFGQRTIRISNGVDFDSIPVHRYAAPDDESIHIIGVAEVHYWHGYDRFLVGLGEYYKITTNPRRIIFHVVGGIGDSELYGSVNSQGLMRPIHKYNLYDKVVFHGQLFGEQLDEVFNMCCFAIGSLARHRSGIVSIKTLKNREYATRGIPFIYSEKDDDFDGQTYVIKATPDESPIDINQIIDFIDSHHFDPIDIRQSVTHLSWKNQMACVIEECNSN